MKYVFVERKNSDKLTETIKKKLTESLIYINADVCANLAFYF